MLHWLVKVRLCLENISAIIKKDGSTKVAIYDDASTSYDEDFLNQYSMILIIFSSSFLMISDLNFFSLKFSNYSLKDNIEKYLIIFISLLILILIGVQSLYIIVLVYISISLVTSLFKIFSKHNI